MEMTQVVDWSSDALRMALCLGAWPMVAALAVGLLVGIVQTLTQMHDPVVGLVPRLVAVTLAVLATLPWLVSNWVAYTQDLIGSMIDRL